MITNKHKYITDIALGYEGIKEYSDQHLKLVDDYNEILPHPRGYKLQYRDSWCAAYVSVVMLYAGISTFPFECGAMEMKDLLLAQGCGIRGRLPQAGEIIFYTYSHVGIVIGSNPADNLILSVEGNSANSVRVNSHYFGDRSILCFASPWKYTFDEIVYQTRHGWYGDGAIRITGLRSAGYSPSQVQQAVNLMILKEDKSGLGKG